MPRQADPHTGIQVMQTNVDTIAASLSQMGDMARIMPPSWDGAKDTLLAAGPNGEYFGKVLPGRGLYLAHDLKSLGIKRPIRNVYERSLLMRAVEAGDKYGQMRGRVFDAEKLAIQFLDLLSVITGRLVPACAITTYDGIISGRAGGKADDIVWVKDTFTTVANAWSSLYRATGLPVAGSYANIPGGAAKDRTDAGALSLGLTSPSAPDLKYLLTIGFGSSAQINMILLFDLLVAAGNILATINTSQTVNSAALTRYTTGAGVQAILEITTAIGTTASNLNMNSYTNQAGTAARSSPVQAMTVSAIAQRLAPAVSGPFLPLQSGDYGVKSVENIILSAAMTAGIMALNLYKPLAFLPGIAAVAYVERDSTVQIDGLTELVQTSGNVIGCLNAFVIPNSTVSGGVQGFFRTVAG